jgi:hypothetical protein
LFVEACEAAEWDALTAWRDSNEPGARDRFLAVDTVRSYLRALVDDATVVRKSFK